MARVNFYVHRRSDTSGAVPIYLSFAFDGHRLYYYTGQSVKGPSNWVNYRDGKDGTRKIVQRVKSTAPGATSLNAFLDDLEQKVLDIYRKGLQEGKTLSAGFILDELKKAKGKGMPSVLEAFDAFIEAKKFDNSEGYIKRLKVIKNDLQAFSKAKGVPLDFNGFNDSFFLKLHKYYLEDLGNQSNTMLTKQKILRRFLIWASKPSRKYLKNQDFKEEKLIKERPSNRFALMRDEVIKLALHKLNDADMAMVRDAFVLSCYTGIRLSDIKCLKPSNIFDDRIEYFSMKEDIKTIVPLVPFTRQLVHRYKSIAGADGLVFPIKVTDQHINRQLKDIAEDAELTRDISQHENLPTGRVAKDDKKIHEVISFHISRHTAKTLSNTLADHPMPSVIQDIFMGHTPKGGVSEGYNHAKDNLNYIISEYNKVFGDLIPEHSNN